MRILAIESSSLVASVAITEDGIMIAEYTINYKKTHSQTLLPMIDNIINMIELDKSTIDAIAISGGPGSFTGLRIGSATAKGLGLALSKPLINVPTLEAMAYNLQSTEKLVCPIMDARRNQVYTGVYDASGIKPIVIMDQTAISIDELIARLSEIGKKVIFVGDGIPVFKNVIEERIPKLAEFAPAHLNRQRAGAVAALASVYYSEGKTETATEHNPDYLRVSQAERELAEKNNRLNL